LSLGSSCITPIMLKHFPSRPSLLKIFIIKECQIIFLALWKLSCDFYSSSINVVYCINWFSHSEPSLHPRDKVYLVMVSDSFNLW
jgi:hypothetical protein